MFLLRILCISTTFAYLYLHPYNSRTNPFPLKHTCMYICILLKKISVPFPCREISVNLKCVCPELKGIHPDIRDPNPEVHMEDCNDHSFLNVFETLSIVIFSCQFWKDYGKY